MTSTKQISLSLTSSSVRKRLSRDVILLVLLLISLFLALAFYYSKQIQYDISHAIINSTKKMVIDKVTHLFEPVSDNLVMSKKWAQLESLTPEQGQLFNKRFIPILQTLPQISAVILADSNGREYFFTRHNEHWLSRHINSNQSQTATWTIWNSNNQQIKQWQETTEYNSKDRPWYTMGLNTKPETPIKWTKPYSFYTQKTPGVTGATSWKDKNNIDYILAFDVTLSNIAKSITSSRIGNNDIAFLISQDGEVILPPGNQHIVKGTHQTGSLYAPAKDSHNYVIFDSVNHWIKQNNPLSQAKTFVRDGNTWWYQVFTLTPQYESLLAGVIVAEKALTDIINEKRALILSGIAILVIMSVILANFLVRKYSHQLKDLPKTSISKDDFKNEIYQLLRLGESETLEFKSTMRCNLKSGKNGKEIEIAWLKGLVGFMNTHGGILLIGIDDDANIVGIEADKFDNEDKIKLHFKNLLSQHIGLEFSNYINLIVNSIDDKTILVIECERANRPVFLFNKNDEAFYIRSGPASVKLSVSKVIRYVQNRY